MLCCVAVECLFAVSVSINIKYLGDENPRVHVEVIVGLPVIRQETHFKLQRVAVMNFWLDAYHSYN